jgi:hypothetical protein
MSTVFKFQITPEPGAFTVDMPAGANIIAVRVQGNAPMLYAEVDPAAPREDVRLVNVYTGDTIDRTRHVYVGTWQIESANPLLPFLVGHVYLEVVRDTPARAEAGAVAAAR